MEKWHLIQNQPSLQQIFKEPPIISLKKSKSLNDILVRAKNIKRRHCINVSIVRSRAGLSLLATSDGTKLKPMVVFRGAKREVAALNQEFKQQAVVATSANAWMDTGLTEVWIDSVLGSFSFNLRLLAWDSFECHIEESITHALQSKKICRVIVPGGCTKYVQAPDICWNKLFKVACTEKYDGWLGTVGIHEETAAGNLKAPPRRTILQWILDSWAELPAEVIKNLSQATEVIKNLSQAAR